MKKMSYDTYAYLRALLELEEDRLENDYRIACSFIPQETPRPNEPSGLQKAHQIFAKEWTKIRDMKEELHDAAAACYKDANPKMRKFWGLK